jgi:hypothetical protein
LKWPTEIELKFWNEQSTATKEALEIAIFVCTDQTPETTKRLAQTQMSIKILLFRCGSFSLQARFDTEFR